MLRRRVAIHEDTARFLAMTAKSQDKAILWLRRHLDWATGLVVIPCRCDEVAGRYPIWTMDSPAKRERLDFNQLRTCARCKERDERQQAA